MSLIQTAVRVRVAVAAHVCQSVPVFSSPDQLFSTAQRLTLSCDVISQSPFF